MWQQLSWGSPPPFPPLPPFPPFPPLPPPFGGCGRNRAMGSSFLGRTRHRQVIAKKVGHKVSTNRMHFSPHVCWAAWCQWRISSQTWRIQPVDPQGTRQAASSARKRPWHNFQGHQVFQKVKVSEWDLKTLQESWTKKPPAFLLQASRRSRRSW